MRVFVAGLIGAIVMFLWGALSHMVLGIGDKGMNVGTPYAATLAALKQDAPKAGIYYLPSTSKDKMSDPAAQAALAADSGGIL